MTTGHIFFETIANLSIWCLLQCLRQGYKCREKAHLAIATSVVQSSSTKVRSITAHSSRHLSPPWNTHKEKRSKILLLDTNGSTYTGSTLSLNYYLIKDMHLPEDELASFSPSCCDRKFWVTGIRSRAVELNINVY